MKVMDKAMDKVMEKEIKDDNLNKDYPFIPGQSVLCLGMEWIYLGAMRKFSDAHFFMSEDGNIQRGNLFDNVATTVPHFWAKSAYNKWLHRQDIVDPRSVPPAIAAPATAAPATAAPATAAPAGTKWVLMDILCVEKIKEYALKECGAYPVDSERFVELNPVRPIIEPGMWVRESDDRDTIHCSESYWLERAIKTDNGLGWIAWYYNPCYESELPWRVILISDTYIDLVPTEPHPKAAELYEIIGAGPDGDTSW